jgi:hypothetical protein
MTEISHKSLLHFVRIMASAMDAGDPYTHGRSYRCSKYAVSVGRRMGLNEGELYQIELAGLLQDVGKRMVLHSIQRKAGELNQIERMQMNNHAKICSDLLGRFAFLKGAAAIIASLNERFDGNGIPAQLSGTSIPVASRILAIVSALDAMTSDRPHRPGMSAQDAYAELRNDGGRRFDPRIAEIAIRMHESQEIQSDLDSRIAILYQAPEKQEPKKVDESERIRQVGGVRSVRSIRPANAAAKPESGAAAGAGGAAKAAPGPAEGAGAAPESASNGESAATASSGADAAAGETAGSETAAALGAGPSAAPGAEGGEDAATEGTDEEERSAA